MEQMYASLVSLGICVDPKHVYEIGFAVENVYIRPVEHDNVFHIQYLEGSIPELSDSHL